MKLIKFILPSLFIGLSLSSCNLDVDDDDNYSNQNFPCCNLVVTEDGDAFALSANYTLTFYPFSNQVTVTAQDLNLGGKDLQFTTNNMKAETKLYNVSWSDLTLDVTTFDGGSAEGNGVSVRDLNGFTSSVFNLLNTKDPKNPAYPWVSWIPLVINYKANGCTVKTFSPDAIYRGTTTIATMGSTDAPFSNDEIRYRIIFNKELNKADIIFYNAKFADRMPVTINFVLQNLDVTYNDNGYNITAPAGEPLIPQLYEASGLTPAPNYQFTSFNFTNTSPDLTVGAATYTVQMGPASYNGTFQGYYVLSGPENNH